MLLVDTTPRVRGLREDERVLALANRYNPACAGTTRAGQFLQRDYQIQPRVCGDYNAPHFFADFPSDTTPRVRGLRSIFGRPCIR